jgi:hypothetical protein
MLMARERGILTTSSIVLTDPLSSGLMVRKRGMSTASFIVLRDQPLSMPELEELDYDDMPALMEPDDNQ